MANIPVFKENDTFRYDEPSFLNACVGQNGVINGIGNDIFYYYVGFSQATLQLIDYQKKTNGREIDALIYPICFNGRHSIELFLKLIIWNIACLYNMVTGKEDAIITVQQLNKNHDIKLLWEFLKKNANIIPELSTNINSIDSIILDFCEIDSNGQTFRYPESLDGKHHLDNFSNINILPLETNLKKLYATFDKLMYLFQAYYNEAKTGTFIYFPDINQVLLRSKIKEIAQKLPNISTWKDSSFDIIRNSLKTEYGFSSKKLAKVIDLIKEHSEFSSFIGIEKNITRINKKQLTEYKTLFEEYQQKREEVDTITELKNEYANKISKIFTIFTCKELFAFSEIGRYENLLCEDFERIIKQYEEEKNKRSFIFFYLLDKKNLLETIRSGLIKCGQNGLSAVI